MKNRLIQLFKDNRNASARKPLRAEVQGDEATLYLYDFITSDDYWGGITAENFCKELRSCTASVIHLRINCPGGDVFAARAMEQALRECKAKTIAHVDGYAASAASYVALACDEVEINPGGMFMIHQAWTISLGNSDDLRATADLLQKIDDALVATYARETGQDEDTLRALVEAETWLDAQESVDLGFADRIACDCSREGDETDDGTCKNAWNFNVYAQAKKRRPAKAETQAEPTCDQTGRAACERRQGLIDLGGNHG